MSAGSGALRHVVLRAGELRLQPPERAQAHEALAMMTDPDIAQWNPAPKVVDLESAADWLERGADWDAHFAVWSILDADGRLVGSCTLWQIDRTDQLSAAVGYRTAPWARGRGVATAAVRAMADWALGDLGLERIELVHAVANPASCVVAERSGFVLEGTLRQDFRTTDGRRWDTHLHGLLASEVR